MSNHVQQFSLNICRQRPFSAKNEILATRFFLFQTPRSMAFIQGNLNFYLSMLQLSPPPSPATSEVARVRPNFRTRVVYDMPYSCQLELHFLFCILLFGVCISWPRANPFVLSLKPWQESLNEVWKMAPADLVYPRVIFPAEKKHRHKHKKPSKRTFFVCKCCFFRKTS